MDGMLVQLQPTALCMLSDTQFALATAGGLVTVYELEGTRAKAVAARDCKSAIWAATRISALVLAVACDDKVILRSLLSDGMWGVKGDCLVMLSPT